MAFSKEQLDNCTCVDPYKPSEKLLACGSDVCKALQKFYACYIKYGRSDKEDKK